MRLLGISYVTTTEYVTGDILLSPSTSPRLCAFLPHRGSVNIVHESEARKESALLIPSAVSESLNQTYS